jgi:phosphoglycerate dehydrogenase-like enzyme
LLTAPAGPVTVVIASPIEPELVERIRDVDRERVTVVHEPDLIPRARFAADHTGVRPELDAAGVERWLAVLRSADVLLDVDWYAPADLPRNAPKLRWVQATRSGVGEHLRCDGLDRTSIVFTNCAGVHAVPLAEFVLLGLLYFVKDVPLLRDEQARRSWEPAAVRVLAGSRVLLVGLGGLGREIARRLAALGVEVWGVRRSDAAAPEGVARLVRPDELLDALGQAAALVVAAPSTAETRRMIGAAELAALPRGAIVVNIARGTLLDEAALVDALRSGHLGGAALDVTEVEPLPPDSPLWDLPNVLLSPHKMSIVEAENGLIVDLFVDNLRRFLDGRPLRNVFDPARGY